MGGLGGGDCTGAAPAAAVAPATGARDRSRPMGTYAASNAEMREAVLGLFGGHGAQPAGSHQ